MTAHPQDEPTAVVRETNLDVLLAESGEIGKKNVRVASLLDADGGV
jgi:hypothetical protein